MGFIRNIKNSLAEYISKFLAGDDVSEYSGIGVMSVDREVAMKYSAVFSCVRVLSETFATCPAQLYRKNKDGTREISTDLQIYDILHNQPNDEMAPFGFKESQMVSLNTGGNSVCLKLVNKYNDIVGLYPLEWQKLRMERKNGQLLYYYRDDSTQNIEKTYSRSEVFHVPGISFDGVIGLSPIEYMASAITLGLSYEKFGVKFYQNGANASGVFSFPGALGDVAYERLKKDLAKNYTGLANTGKPILLESGGTFNQLTIKPVDAQLLESKKFQLEDVARCYRVPLHLIQNLDKATNNNIEHQSLEFIMYTMLPWFKRYEENANAQLLKPKERKAGYYIEFKMDSLLRGDMATRSAAYAAGRQWGWLSVNDIRRLENMPPVDNGDIYLQPSNMIEAGQQLDQAGAMTAKITEMIGKGGRA
ncbi:MAG: phage portal protein, family [Firmicutes bacterium]|nr:phage portal protein, family [Bacillota bacterium]